MKRFFSFFLSLCLLVSMCGCSSSLKEETGFYYCRAEYLYGEENSVICMEQRDVSGHAEDLPYLISLYLAGPSDEDLSSPFPGNTRLLSVQVMEDTVLVELSELNTLTESHFSLGCACLALTCLKLTEAEYITIISADRSITISSQSLTLYDNNHITTASTEEPR